MLGRIMSKRFMSSSTGDPVAKLFFDPKVQDALKALTGLKYDKVFRLARRGKRLDPPKYTFMTDKELKEAQIDAKKRAMELLQMPPVMSPRKDVENILEEDPALKGFDAAKYVFTDITYGVHNRDRMIVVREPDGTLRDAYWSERDRMNLIYFPSEGRRFKPAAFFEDENLKEVMNQDKYLHVLDTSCVQFEPDHPKFIKVAHMVYDNVDANGSYDVLHSTRYYGPMVFYFVMEKKIDNLLIHYLKNLDLENACKVIQLYVLIHPKTELKGVDDIRTEESQISLMKNFIRNVSKKETKLKMTLESMLETAKRNQKSIKQT